MATYPARCAGLASSLATLAPQVDEITLVANEYMPGSFDVPLPRNVRIVFPLTDMKDVGKFMSEAGDDDFLFLCDDDILYPDNYAEALMRAYHKYKTLSAVVGLHGVIYSDFFDGRAGSRIVYVFTEALESDRFVNQLGTGALLCRGAQMPALSFMQNSAKFVDLRFAIHCQRCGFPRIALARSAGWMKEIGVETSVFEDFTRHWPSAVTRESQEIAGLRLLPSTSPEALLAAAQVADR